MKFYPIKLFPITPATTSRYTANLIPRHGNLVFNSVLEVLFKVTSTIQTHQTDLTN